MDDETSFKSPASSGRFAVLTSPVRGFAERAAGRAWPGRHNKPAAAAGTAPGAATHGRGAADSGHSAQNASPSTAPALGVQGLHEKTPEQSFATSEVISAFHLQQLHLPSDIERATRGAVTGGKVAIVASAFALVSLLGFGLWASSPSSNGDEGLAVDTAVKAVTTSHLEPGVATSEHAAAAAGAAQVASRFVDSAVNGAMDGAGDRAIDTTGEKAMERVRPGKPAAASASKATSAAATSRALNVAPHTVEAAEPSRAAVSEGGSPAPAPALETAPPAAMLATSAPVAAPASVAVPAPTPSPSARTLPHVPRVRREQ